MKRIALVFAFLALSTAAEARLVRLRVERRELILAGKPFGLAGPYEKLVGKVDFALDPQLPANEVIVDLALAPRTADGEVVFSADFYLLKPVDPRRFRGESDGPELRRWLVEMIATFADPRAERYWQLLAKIQ